MKEKTYKRLAKIGSVFVLYYLIFEQFDVYVLRPIHYDIIGVLIQWESALLFLLSVVLIFGFGSLILIPLAHYGWKKD